MLIEHYSDVKAKLDFVRITFKINTNRMVSVYYRVTNESEASSRIAHITSPRSWGGQS